VDTRLESALNQAANADDVDALVEVLTDIRRGRVRTLGPLLPSFLTHHDPEVRAAAARAVGDLGVVSAEEQLRGLAESDPDRDVRQGAVYGWSSLHSGDRTPEVAETLERWLRDPQEPTAVRAASFWGLLDVAGLPLDQWPAPVGFDDIDAEVPWDVVEDVMADLRTQQSSP